MVTVNGITYADHCAPGSPRFVYADMDSAIMNATCLCALDAAGATVHYRVTEANDEEYMVTTAAVRIDGVPWDLIGEGWEACYTITKPKR